MWKIRKKTQHSSLEIGDKYGRLNALFQTCTKMMVKESFKTCINHKDKMNGKEDSSSHIYN